jgi:hypothetical protein
MCSCSNFIFTHSNYWYLWVNNSQKQNYMSFSTIGLEDSLISTNFHFKVIKTFQNFTIQLKFLFINYQSISSLLNGVMPLKKKTLSFSTRKTSPCNKALLCSTKMIILCTEHYFIIAQHLKQHATVIKKKKIEQNY